MTEAGPVFRPFFVLVLLLVGAFAALPVAAPAAGLPCEGYQHVAGFGPACPEGHGWRGASEADASVFIHGLDPVPGHQNVHAYTATPVAPACVDDPASEYHGHAIYAYPLVKGDDSARRVPEIRQMLAQVNGQLRQEAAEFDLTMDYRFRCEDGEALVSVVGLPFPRGQGEYLRLRAALLALGFDDKHAKYWVWYDDPSSCPCAGIAEAPLDSTRAPFNNANTGPHFGATYGYGGLGGALIMMHENGHNMGAVHDLAPDSSGAGHCNDGLDIMCYGDGGPTAAYSSRVCTDRVHFDCGHDTYFNPAPPDTGWSARRWNLGSPLNRFSEGCLYHVGTTPLDGSATVVEIPAACQDHRFALYGELLGSPARSALTRANMISPGTDRLQMNDFDVCWYDNTTLLSCDTKGAWTEARVPATATRAEVTLVSGDLGQFILSIV